MGKRVRVVTKCGETFTYDHDQEVETVEIVETNKGADLVDSDNDYIFAMEPSSVEKGYYIEKFGSVFRVVDSDGDEVGFIGRKYGNSARLRG